MNKRNCPCCQEEISKKYFLKQILIGRGSISLTEKEKGLVCQKCNRQILSAEKKFLITLTLMLVSMIPMMIFGSTYEFSSPKERIIKLVLVFVVSFMIWVILILKKFDTIEFVCDEL